MEGYVESAASGLWLGLVLAARARGAELPTPPAESALGALLRHLLGVWQEQGLRGVEVYHPSAGRATPLLDLTARRMGFLVTGGSDFHGDGDRHGMVGCTAPMWARAADDVEKLLQAVEAAEIM